jgi:diaminopimelate decarboxylase
MLLGTQRISERGRLEVGGCDTVELAREYGTPLYVMDEEAIRSACRAYREAFESRYPANRIHYAGKAFLCAAMCKIAEQEGLGLDVAASGELYTAISAGFPMDRVNLHGNNKSPDEIRMALRHRVGHVTLDNFTELELVAKLLTGRSRRAEQAVLVRCAPGVDPETHRFMRTGQADTKFGFNIADGSALEAVRRVMDEPGLQFQGIHFHVGSQLTDTDSHEGAIEAAVELMADIRAKTGAACAVLNIGGGLGVRYVSDSTHLTLDDFAHRLVETLTTMLAKHGLPQPVLAQEPGRAIVGEAGLTLYTVGAVKTVPIVGGEGWRTYASVDGGLSDNPRPQLYDAVYEAVCASRASEAHDSTVAIAGKHCETDVLIWEAKCPPLCPGDVIAVQTTGAYNHAMASNYNRVTRPAVVLVGEGRSDVIVQREKVRDLVRRDLKPPRLFGANSGAVQ